MVVRKTHLIRKCAHFCVNTYTWLSHAQLEHPVYSSTTHLRDGWVFYWPPDPIYKRVHSMGALHGAQYLTSVWWYRHIAHLDCASGIIDFLYIVSRDGCFCCTWTVGDNNDIIMCVISVMGRLFPLITRQRPSPVKKVVLLMCKDDPEPTSRDYTN